MNIFPPPSIPLSRPEAPRRSRLLRSLTTGMLLAFSIMLSWVACATEQTAAAEPEGGVLSVPETLKSPRRTMDTFLRSMNDIKRGQPERIEDAVSTLDLSEINSLVRPERGRDLAWTLLEVLDRTEIVDLKRIPERKDGEPYLFHRYQPGAIRIERQHDGRWLFSRDTLAALPQILESLSSRDRVKGDERDEQYLPWHLRIGQRMPESLKQTVLLLENWKWLAVLIIIGFGVLVDKAVSVLLSLVVRQWRRKTEKEAYREVSDRILRPFALMAMAVAWWLGINFLGLPESAMLVLLVAVKFLAGLSGVWAAYRLVDLAGAHLYDRARQTENRFDDVVVPLITRTLKVFVTVVGVVFIADNLNLNVTSLVAGLGLGGLAFALAAKDVVQNLFGSLTVLFDQTFHVGDWVVIGKIEGTVEQIGFRSTRIRTFYNSLITVPNSALITANVDNMGARRFRRLSCKLSLTYETPPDKIEAFCEGVRELIRNHPFTRKDYFQVYLNEFAAASLEILLYVFWETPDWSTELRERHRLLLDILRLARRLGVDFAFPTQTIYWKQGDPAGVGVEEAAEASPEQALEMGRQSARAIVKGTPGIGETTPPVGVP